MASKKAQVELNVLLLSREEWQEQILQTQDLRAKLDHRERQLGVERSRTYNLGNSLAKVTHDMQQYSAAFIVALVVLVTSLVLVIGISVEDPVAAPSQETVLCDNLQGYYADLGRVDTEEAAANRLTLKAQAQEHGCDVEVK